MIRYDYFNMLLYIIVLLMNINKLNYSLWLPNNLICNFLKRYICNQWGLYTVRAIRLFNK